MTPSPLCSAQLYPLSSFRWLEIAPPCFLHSCTFDDTYSPIDTEWNLRWIIIDATGCHRWNLMNHQASSMTTWGTFNVKVFSIKWLWRTVCHTVQCVPKTDLSVWHMIYCRYTVHAYFRCNAYHTVNFNWVVPWIHEPWMQKRNDSMVCITLQHLHHDCSLVRDHFLWKATSTSSARHHGRGPRKWCFPSSRIPLSQFAPVLDLQTRHFRPLLT